MQSVKPAYGQVKQSWITVLTFVVAGLAIVATWDRFDPASGPQREDNGTFGHRSRDPRPLASGPHGANVAAK